MRLRWPFRTHAWLQSQLDAYVDGELDAGAAALFESHLADCVACASAVASTRSLKAKLVAAPEVAAPRSFRLTPQMAVAQTRPVPAAPRAQLGMRFAQVTAGLAILGLAALVAYDVTGSDSSRSRDTMSSAGLEAAKSAPVQSPVVGLGAAEPSPQPPQTGAATPAPALPTPITGGAGAQSNPTATPPSQPPGRSNSTAPAPGPSAAADAAGTYALTPEQSREAADREDESPSTTRWLEYALGGLAVAAVAGWAGLAFSSRR